MRSLLALGDLGLAELPDDPDVRVTHTVTPVGRPRPVGGGPVAVIGMSGRIGAARDLDEFWRATLRGGRGHGDLSAERRADVDAQLAARGGAPGEHRYWGGTRLPSLAEFDHRFFGLSRQEARLIDPNQRIFLQTAWAALEDAGHLGEDIRGRRVGVYAGMSTDFGDDYRALIQAADPDAPEISVAGNVKSIIASRLAHVLDLRGPSMLVDTACSSGLVAVYTACRAIQNGDCTMAVVGAVNCDLLPVVADGGGIGIKDIAGTSSVDGRTRTFDRRGAGTGPAEGCVVLVLTALDRALRDGDDVRAVILGGAVNQDGASNGITSPNADAQADLIDAALADAGVPAEQISFIEAHGTATRLGDPVEIGGIARAFGRHTSRRQFCGIGTVKSNIGHMDNASGLAGLAKLVLSMRDRTLPATLDFEAPNPGIAFDRSPVYVNDRTAPWGDDPDEPLHAGINSFGLSGTNCHLVLRSADPPTPRPAAPPRTCHLLPLSAPDPAGLLRLAQRLLAFLTSREVDPADLVRTLSTGRLHHRNRAAFVFADHQELLAGLRSYSVDPDGSAPPDLARGRFRPVLDEADRRGPDDRTRSERDQLTREATTGTGGPTPDRAECRRLAALWVRGAELDWSRLVPDGARRVPLPTYPFEPIRCWIDPVQGRARAAARVLRSVDRDVAVCHMSPQRNWQLADHRIDGVCVLPGTGILDMVADVARQLGRPVAGLTLRGVQFLAPLAVADGADSEVHVVVESGDADGAGRVTVASRSAAGAWVRNATAELVGRAGLGAGPVPAPLDLAAVRGRLTRELSYDDGLDRAHGLDLGERWTGSLRGGRTDADAVEFLYEAELPAAHARETDDHVLHPALLDTLINAPNDVHDPDRLYLPFSYGRLTVHRPLPARVLAHFRKRPSSIDGQLYAFDVAVVDPEGRAVLTVDNYCIKSAADLDVGGPGAYGHVPHHLPAAAPPPGPAGAGSAVLICGNLGGALGPLVARLRHEGYDPVLPGRAQDTHLREGRPFAFGVMAAAPQGTDVTQRVGEPVERAAELLGHLAELRADLTGGLLVLTGTGLAVTGRETVDPGQSGLLGLAQVAAVEYRSLGIRCLDIDEHTPPDALVAEAAAAGRPPVVAHRDGSWWQPGLRSHPVLLRDAAPGLVPAEGATIVSGGTGGLGRAVARHLAALGARRIVLLGSDQPDTDRPAAGSELEGHEVIRLDLADRQAVERVVLDVRERYGRVNGVLHLAGRPGRGFLHGKGSDEFRAVYLPKAVGAMHLHEATMADAPDFFVVFSSIAALLPTAGQSDYTAANAALDGLAHHRRALGLPALSVQWPAWRETGMAQRLGAVDEDEQFPPLDTAEGVRLLHALMTATELPPVVMPGRRRASGHPARDVPSAVRSPAAVVVHGLADAGDVGRAVADIWARTLDVAELDAHDTFDELGGNSLLTSQMLRLYDERFPGLMDITDLFRCTTVAEQVECVASRLTPGGDPAGGEPDAGVDDDLDRLLHMVEQGEITVEQSRGLV